MIGRYIDIAIVDIDWYIDTDIVIDRCAYVCVKESERVCECMCLSTREYMCGESRFY